MNAEEIREEVRRLLDIESQTVELDKKQKLALLAFMLAQQAEALARAQPTETASTERKAVADSNIERFVEQLFSEKDATQRKL